MLRELLTRAVLFHPVRGQSRTPTAFGLDYEEVRIATADGIRIQAWWIPTGKSRAVVTMFHGNAGTMADRLENVVRMRNELDVSVLLVEYRGYGDSEGRPTERGLYADGRAAVLEARRRAGDLPVVVFGRSLGGAVAIDAAAHAPIDAVVVEATFTSLKAVARSTGIPFASRIIAYRMDSRAKIARIEAPILIIHGDRDELIPFHMGEQLRDAATSSRAVSFHRVRGGDHNGAWIVGGADYWDAWRTLLDANLRS